MKLKKALCTLPLLGIFLLPFGNVRAADEIAINSTNFPGHIDGRDAVWVIKEYDTDKNGSLSSEEIASCTSLKWSLNDDNYGALYNLTALQELDLSSWSENGLTFDPGKFPQLTSLKLDAHKGKVQAVDLSQCTGLKKLSVGHYGGESLDISYCKDLEEFELEYGSTLDHVDFTKNTKLKVIHCSYINNVNLSKNTALVDLRLDTADTVLDLSNCANLKKLDIKSLKIKDLRLSSKANLEWFEFYANNNGQAYDLSKHTNLTHLSLKAADLKTTDFTKLTKLQYLCVQGSRFKDNILDLTKMPDLEYLSVSQCYMTSLDLSKNTKLKNLYCDSAAITHLDLSHNTALTTLNCSSIDLDELVLTKNTNLTDLYCTGNKTVLNELDLTANSALKSIWISNFKNVKIGNCPDLGTLSASANTETLDLGYCPILHNMYLTKNNIKTVDLSNCPLYIRAIDSFESVVSDTEVRTTGTLSVTYNGKTSDMSCIFSLDPSIKVITDKISIAGSFPDAKLGAYVSEVADKNKDGILSKDEIAAVVTFDCSGKGIADLTGLEVFNNIETLDCSHNALTSVNANAFPKLKKLICSDNQLTNDTLVTDKVGLVYLDCSYNKLTVLEKRNPDTLETIKISHNELKSSSLYNYKKLRHLEINDNQLKSFMLTANIEYLDCSNNLIESMVMLNDEGKALKTLNCSNNKLSHLDLENCEGLESLKAYGNVFSAYPIQLNRNMSDLYPDRVEKKVDGVDCVVFGDKYFFDVGTKFRYFLKIDEKNFPDAGLRKALAKYDTDSDGYYNELERKIDKLDCSGYQIKDLTGLELLRVNNLDCSFNDLSELNIRDLTNDDNVIDIVTCYGNPKLKSVVVYKVFTALGPQYVTMSEKTATVKVGGKDVTIDYDCYSAFGALEMNVDRGVRLVGDPVNISVIVPEGAGVVTGDGLNEKDTEVTLEFKPADGVTFSGWFENGTLVSSDLTLTITASEEREFTIACTLPQALVFENANIKKTVADKPFTVKVGGAKTAVVYSSSNTKVAKVDAATGKVTLTGVGECTITAKAGASDLYKEGTASYKLTVVAVPTATPTATPKPTATSTPKVTATPKVTSKPEPTTVPEDPKAQILAFVERIYIYVLNREPEEEGAAFWSDELYSFRRTGAEVAQGFIFSEEFVNRNTSDKEFVTILYKTFFGRDPEEAGMNFWLEQLATGTMDRFTVANGFIYSQEWADTCASYGIRSGGDLKPTGKIAPTELTYAFVERMYTTALGRGYDEEGKQYWASELANFNITGESVGAFFFLSDEMNGYGLSDQEYLNRLYATFMNREPDADGAAYWLSVLGSGTPRADVVFGFTRSPEFTEKCVEARILPY